MGGATPLTDEVRAPVLTGAGLGPQLDIGRDRVSLSPTAPAASAPDPGWPSGAGTAVPPRPRRTLRGRYGLRGRHVRERGGLRVPLPFTVAHVVKPEDQTVLQALRRNAVVDLDAAQIAVAAALSPSQTAPALDRLVRAGLVNDSVVGGRRRFGLP